MAINTESCMRAASCAGGTASGADEVFGSDELDEEGWNVGSAAFTVSSADADVIR